MNEFEVEKGIPYTKEKDCTKVDNRTVCKYPWGSMEVGDSFYVDGHSQGKQCSIISSASKWASRNNKNWKYSSRKQGDGIRIYRVK